MRYIRDFKEGLAIFEALGSEVRISILQLLMEQGRMSMNDLAKALGLTNGAITSHIKKLENAELISINAEASGHGNQKICEPHLDKILFVFSNSNKKRNEYGSHLRVGQYSSCKIYPTCGLSTASSIIGAVDDPRYFTHQKRFEADILWFTRGFVEYMIPCVVPSRSRITSISISAELSSEAPGSNANWPSDIHFYINNQLIGVWQSPGDFADVPGIFTPDWWYSSWNQYGLLKTLTVAGDGTYMDDTQISDVTIDQLALSPRSPIYFRMAVPDTAEHIGGLTIFGRDFGNFNQDIIFRVGYSLNQENS